MSRTGLTAMAECEREFLSTWADLRLAAQEYREIDHERVLVLQSVSGQAKTSGLNLAQVGAKGAACLFHVDDGKVHEARRGL